MTRPRNAKGHFMNNVEFAAYQEAQAAIAVAAQAEADALAAAKLAADTDDTAKKNFSDAVAYVRATVVAFAAEVYDNVTPKAVLKAYRHLFDTDYQTAYAWGAANGFK